MEASVAAAQKAFCNLLHAYTDAPDADNCIKNHFCKYATRTMLGDPGAEHIAMLGDSGAEHIEMLGDPGAELPTYLPWHR
jgi:hypothetical protein